MHGGLGAVDATLSRREASSAFARVALCAEQACLSLPSYHPL
jgi:hypothetical protein